MSRLQQMDCEMLVIDRVDHMGKKESDIGGLIFMDRQKKNIDDVDGIGFNLETVIQSNVYPNVSQIK